MQSLHSAAECEDNEADSVDEGQRTTCGQRGSLVRVALSAAGVRLCVGGRCRGVPGISGPRILIRLIQRPQHARHGVVGPDSLQGGLPTPLEIRHSMGAPPALPKP